MRKLDVSKIMMILVAFMGVLELSVGKFIMAGIFFILAFAIYRNGGGASMLIRRCTKRKLMHRTLLSSSFTMHLRIWRLR